MITLFSEEDVLSFGQYMISEERSKSILEAEELTDEEKQEILKSVTPFDYNNWVRSVINSQNQDEE